MAYSCAYWKDANSLDQAQRNKLDLICRKLELEPTDRVLDLGCGFGSFSRYAAENFGCSIVAVTLSNNQAGYAREFCRDLPVEIHVTDYRNVDQYSGGKTFDKVASIAMFEAIGRKNFRSHMEIIDRMLPESGIWLLHTIGDNICSSDPWLEKVHFSQRRAAHRRTDLEIRIGAVRYGGLPQFRLGLSTYPGRVEVNFRKRWDVIRDRNVKLFTQRFFRMWIYYLNLLSGRISFPKHAAVAAGDVKSLLLAGLSVGPITNRLT